MSQSVFPLSLPFVFISICKTSNWETPYEWALIDALQLPLCGPHRTHICLHRAGKQKCVSVTMQIQVLLIQKLQEETEYA